MHFDIEICRISMANQAADQILDKEQKDMQLPLLFLDSLMRGGDLLVWLTFGNLLASFKLSESLSI